MIGQEKLQVLDKIKRELQARASCGENGIWKMTLQGACFALKCEAGTFFTLDEKRRILTARQVLGNCAEDISNLGFGYRGIVGWCAQNRKPVISNDAAKDPRFCTQVDYATGFHTKAALCVPAIHEERFFGVVELLNPVAGVFSEEDREALESLCAFSSELVYKAAGSNGKGQKTA